MSTKEMESTEFLAFINNPVSVDAQSLKQFEEVQKEYPFCQTAHLLYALNLYAEEHPQYAVQLKRASVYAADRRQLKHLIDRYRITHPRPTATPKITFPAKPVVLVKSPEPPRTQSLPPTPKLQGISPPLPSPPISRRPVTFSPLSTPLPTPPHQSTTASPSPSLTTRVAFKPVIPSDDEPQGRGGLREKLMEIVHRRLTEIAEEHGGNPDFYQPSGVGLPPLVVQGKQHVTFSVKSSGPYSKEELIEKFIREEPRISSPRKVFLKPTHIASRDSQEDDEIVSETLAILYHKQGNTGKSIRVYEKLCLLFPEKSSYFAARIESLKAQKPPDNEGYES